MENNSQYLYLTTIGRNSGLPHEIEIWFTKLNGHYYLIAEKRERANWVRNIIQNPAVSFRVEGQSFRGIGRVINQNDELELLENVRTLSDRKYGWSEGLVVELIPHALSDSQ